MTAGIANKDGDTKIQKRAVYTLEDLPDNERIPYLIDIAKINQKVTVQKAAFVALEKAITRALFVPSSKSSILEIMEINYGN